jgi:hypothetical protein
MENKDNNICANCGEDCAEWGKDHANKVLRKISYALRDIIDASEEQDE